MGKNFKNELHAIPDTYVAAKNEDVKEIKRFLGLIGEEPVVLIGSGGSYAVAVAAEYLLRRIGVFCKAITPLELPQYNSRFSKISAIIFTAGGRNADTKNAYRYLNEIESRYVLTICMRKDAPILHMQEHNLHSLYFDFALPTKKDGFLAVNSSIAAIALLAKAIYELTNDVFYRLPSEISFREMGQRLENVSEIAKKETYIVLYGGLSAPAAYDLESKFSEASLGNVQLVDFRNFAHGRHFWLSSRKDRTIVVALACEAELAIAKQTLKYLPEGIPQIELFTQEQNIGGMLALLVDAFSLVSIVGDEIGVDPGKPKVPEFGRKLYHLNCNPCMNADHKQLKKSILVTAAKRKSAQANGDLDIWKKFSSEYMDRLQSKQFRGIIFDYDGTLHLKRKNVLDSEREIFQIINRLLRVGIYIGISTGRGKSVRKELQAVIEEKYWPQVAVGYYNGGCIASLDDDQQPDTSENTLKILAQVEEDLCLWLKSQDICEGISVELRPKQLTIQGDDVRNVNLCASYCKEKQSSSCGFKVVSSSHSVDIIPASTTKTNIIEFFARNDSNLGKDDFLFVGDSGQLGGNDFEMLQERYSLSVDYVSSAISSCWNFSPLGVRNLDATCFYLNKLVLHETSQTFEVKIKSK